MLLLIPALDTYFWHNIPHIFVTPFRVHAPHWKLTLCCAGRWMHKYIGINTAICLHKRMNTKILCVYYTWIPLYIFIFSGYRSKSTILLKTNNWVYYQMSFHWYYIYIHWQSSVLLVFCISLTLYITETCAIYGILLWLHDQSGYHSTCDSMWYL